jgi:hypothetical protein
VKKLSTLVSRKPTCTAPAPASVKQKIRKQTKTKDLSAQRAILQERKMHDQCTKIDESQM